MPKYRNHLPQLGDQRYLTDSGLETTMIFHEGFHMPQGEAFKFIDTEEGRAWFRGYFRRHVRLAQERGLGFVLESTTWRANSAWGARLGFAESDLVRINKDSVALIAELRKELETRETPMVVSGNIGPLGDGYRPDTRLTAQEAEEQHTLQARAFAETEADMITAMTMTTVEEALGVVRAAQKADMPVCISFTVETDGRLPTGQTLKEAISAVDAASRNGPAYYMINCAHPTHFMDALRKDEAWLRRVRAIRANASRRSHAELDESPELDIGNPEEMGREYRTLLALNPGLTVLGGCCGTDHRHVREIAENCVPRLAA